MEAILIGATGLVGKEILLQLLGSQDVSRVRVFGRRSVQITHPKLIEKIIDFGNLESWQSAVVGDVLISALGTTLKSAGSKEAQYMVDHDYQLNFALAASRNQVKKLVLVSSANADPESSFFYLRMKGQLEKRVSALDFSSIQIIRPGPLKGQREVRRIGETLSVGLLELLPKKLVGKKYRPISAEEVARKCVAEALRETSGITLHSPETLFDHHIG